MTRDLKDQFARRIGSFFNKRDIYIKPQDEHELIGFLYNTFQNEGRFRQNKFSITGKFVLNAVSNYMKLSAHNTVVLFRSLHQQRLNTRYSRDSSLQPDLSKGHHKYLINLLGRRHTSKYKLTKANGESLSPARITKAQKLNTQFDVGFSPLKPINTGKARERAIAAQGEDFFEKEMATDSVALWRKQTPTKESSPHRVRIKNIDRTISKRAKKLLFAYDGEVKKNQTDFFEFVVTQEDILSRMGVKRPMTQKRAMGNVSAMEIMEAMGAVITAKQNGRNFHLAHRQGWSLNGAQSKDNLDPTTAGSNFDTLFKIEAPLTQLLLKNDVAEVFVRGTVEHDQNVGLPFKITYNLSWGALNSIEVVIDPMNHKIPTIEQHDIAVSFFEMAVNNRMN